jgi:hypothetical protein
MKGFIHRTLTTVSLAGGLAVAAGCTMSYHDCCDPCYPERYEAVARQETVAAIAPQVRNGHVLDQTVFSTEFDPGSDQLTAAGMEHLAYLARRRPAPDPVIFVQTAQDVPYDGAAPDKFVDARRQLDLARAAAVKKYLLALTADQGLTFTVFVHNPPDVGISAIEDNVAVQQLQLSSQGVLKTQGGTIAH